MKRVAYLLLILAVFASLIGCRAPNLIYPTGFQKTKTSIAEYPFQVLHAEGVHSSKTNETVDRLDYVQSTDQLRLQDGHLILVHHSGKFAEFEGSVTIDIDSLRKTFRNYAFQNARLDRRPDLTMIFSDNKSMTPESNSISIAGPHLEKFKSPIFCLNWYSDSTTEFSVYFKDAFSGKVVDVIDVDGYSLSVDLSESVDSLDYGIVRMEIVDRANSQNFVGAMVLLNGTSQYDPDYCADVSALQSLEIACHLVWSENWQSTDFFKNASELSDKPFYKELLRLGQLPTK